MKKEEKVRFLIQNHHDEWMKTRKLQEDLLSESQPMWCICGRLATGLHESHCRKFQDRVDTVTVEKLKHLLPNK